MDEDKATGVEVGSNREQPPDRASEERSELLEIGRIRGGGPSHL